MIIIQSRMIDPILRVLASKRDDNDDDDESSSWYVVLGTVITKFDYLAGFDLYFDSISHEIYMYGFSHPACSI